MIEQIGHLTRGLEGSYPEGKMCLTSQVLTATTEKEIHSRTAFMKWGNEITMLAYDLLL